MRDKSQLADVSKTPASPQCKPPESESDSLVILTHPLGSYEAGLRYFYKRLSCFASGTEGLLRMGA